MDKKGAETVVRVFGIIGIVFSALAVIGGLILAFGGSFIAGMLGDVGTLVAGIATAGGIVLIVISALMIWFYVALMKYTNWARILLSILAILGFIGALFSLPGSILSLVYDGLFVYFFLFDKTVTGLFK
ncbi:hypothetical protein K9L97_05575 [Candidatus Woesearchaeota archaeon]|nr:hypothetical protein [Candidatus Woesearchaeota archaeon]